MGVPSTNEPDPGDTDDCYLGIKNSL